MDVRVQVSNVKWDFSDTPGKKPKLPKDFILEMDVESDDEDEIEDQVSDAISDKYGYCHYGYSFYVIKPMIQQAGD